jgi:hypothetical protein
MRDHSVVRPLSVLDKKDRINADWPGMGLQFTIPVFERSNTIGRKET